MCTDESMKQPIFRAVQLAAFLLLIPVSLLAQSPHPFAPDTMDTVLYGVAYYSEYMPYERLEQDIQLMQQAGINVVRLGPGPGCYVDAGTYSPPPSEVGPACGRREKRDGCRTEITDAV